MDRFESLVGIGESVGEGELSDIREAAFDDDSLTAIIRLFKPGCRGNAGKGDHYYPKDLATPKAIAVFKDTVGYVDHETPERRGLERQLREMAFEVQETMVDNGIPKARVEFFDPGIYQLAKRARRHIGVSMVGKTLCERGMAPDGKMAKIVREFLPGIRCDLVTEPGAGGAIDWIREARSAGGDNTMDFSTVTVEALEADEKGKLLVSQIREAAITAATEAFKTEREKYEDQLRQIAEDTKKRDLEISTLREAASKGTTAEQQVAELSVVVQNLNAQYQAERTERMIESSIRESAIPAEDVGAIADVLRALPQDKWGATLAIFKRPPPAAPPAAGSVAGAGQYQTSRIQEGARPGYTSSGIPVNGHPALAGLTSDQLDAGLAGFCGMTLEEYRAAKSPVLSLASGS